LRLKKEQLQSISRHPIMATPYTLIGPSMQRLDETKAALDRTMKEKLYNTKQKLISLKRETEALKPSRRIQHVREKLSMLTQSLDQCWAKRRERETRKLQEITKLLKAIDPKNLLQKGYAMVFSEMSKSIITSVRSLSSGDSIRLLFADGDARATVSEKGK
jgi:exodeoxyribonuclease VII large subunit